MIFFRHKPLTSNVARLKRTKLILLVSYLTSVPMTVTFNFKYNVKTFFAYLTCELCVLLGYSTFQSIAKCLKPHLAKGGS